MVPDQPHEGLLAYREPLRKFVLSSRYFDNEAFGRLVK